METTQKIQMAFRDGAMGITEIKEWYIWFKDSRTMVESEPHFGSPLTSWNDQIISKVNTVVMQDRHLTIREIA